MFIRVTRVDVIHIADLRFVSSTHDTANIEWGAASDLDTNEFDEYVIGVDCVACTIHPSLPIEISTASNSYDITGLESSVQYNVWVSVKSSFGQSSVSETLNVSTKPSALSGKYIMLQIDFSLFVQFN